MGLVWLMPLWEVGGAQETQMGCCDDPIRERPGPGWGQGLGVENAGGLPAPLVGSPLGNYRERCLWNRAVMGERNMGWFHHHPPHSMWPLRACTPQSH